MHQHAFEQTQANAFAWHERMRRLDQVIRQQCNFALETKLGGESMAAKIAEACESDDVVMWCCGLADIQLHLDRVGARVVIWGARHP